MGKKLTNVIGTFFPCSWHFFPNWSPLDILGYIEGMVRRTPFKVDSAGQKHDAGAIFIPVEAVERLARAISAMALLSLLSGEGNSSVKGRPHLLTDDMLGR